MDAYPAITDILRGLMASRVARLDFNSDAHQLCVGDEFSTCLAFREPIYARETLSLLEVKTITASMWYRDALPLSLNVLPILRIVVRRYVPE